MRGFRCENCGLRTYFENVSCERCGSALGFLPDRLELAAIVPAGAGRNGVWIALTDGGPSEYRRCDNWIRHDVCNWMIPASAPHDLCTACRLNEVIPDLSVDGNLFLWARLEAAKRRLVYTLLSVGLPVIPKSDDPAVGLSFRFLADPPGSTGAPVMTGHANGVITINVAEADDAEREKRRWELKEPYRTLVGHFRHESGHYYWDLLVSDDPGNLDRFRERFGDERADYGKALERHYETGPPPDWQEHFVSAYASMHPWENWAETWAHFLHMVATLETADAFGLETGFGERQPPERPVGWRDDFQEWVRRWTTLTTAINELNRSMGQPDLYPFVLAPPAVEKLRFVRDLVAEGTSAVEAKTGGQPPGGAIGLPVPPHTSGSPV